MKKTEKKAHTENEPWPAELSQSDIDELEGLTTEDIDLLTVYYLEN